MRFVHSDQPAKFGKFYNLIIGTKWGSTLDSVPNNNSNNNKNIKTKKSQGHMPRIWIDSLFGMFFSFTKNGQNRNGRGW